MDQSALLESIDLIVAETETFRRMILHLRDSEPTREIPAMDEILNLLSNREIQSPRDKFVKWVLSNGKQSSLKTAATKVGKGHLFTSLKELIPRRADYPSGDDHSRLEVIRSQIAAETSRLQTIQAQISAKEKQLSEMTVLIQQYEFSIKNAQARLQDLETKSSSVPTKDSYTSLAGRLPGTCEFEKIITTLIVDGRIKSVMQILEDWCFNDREQLDTGHWLLLSTVRNLLNKDKEGAKNEFSRWYSEHGNRKKAFVKCLALINYRLD